MNLFTYIYSTFWVIFILILYFYNRYKLYSLEKWKVIISLFVGVNALFTGVVLFNQNTIHQEDVTNKISETYEKLSDSLYSKPLNIIITKPNLKHLVKDMYMNNGDSNHYEYNENLTEKIDSINPDEKIVFLEICQVISVYAQYYYLHLDLYEYRDLVKSQNIRFYNILSGYLKYPPFRETVQYYVENNAGYRSQKYLKEFFNIKNLKPKNEIEKKISENKIINGKINGDIKIA